MNFLFIYINCLYWPDLTYLGGTAEIKDASILHAQNAQRITCLNALTYAFYIKINKTHWYCGSIRVDVPLRFLSIRIWVVLHSGMDRNGLPWGLNAWWIKKYSHCLSHVCWKKDRTPEMWFIQFATLLT